LASESIGTAHPLGGAVRPDQLREPLLQQLQLAVQQVVRPVVDHRGGELVVQPVVVVQLRDELVQAGARAGLVELVDPGGDRRGVELGHGDLTDHRRRGRRRSRSAIRGVGPSTTEIGE
jgi:hypothetical protein